MVVGIIYVILYPLVQDNGTVFFYKAYWVCHIKGFGKLSMLSFCRSRIIRPILRNGISENTRYFSRFAVIKQEFGIPVYTEHGAAVLPADCASGRSCRKFKKVKALVFRVGRRHIPYCGPSIGSVFITVNFYIPNSFYTRTYSGRNVVDHFRTAAPASFSEFI